MGRLLSVSIIRSLDSSCCTYLSKYDIFINQILLAYFRKTNHLEKVGKVIKYLEDQSVLNYPGGIPSSLLKTGQQWDFR